MDLVRKEKVQKSTVYFKISTFLREYGVKRSVYQEFMSNSETLAKLRGQPLMELFYSLIPVLWDIYFQYWFRTNAFYNKFSTNKEKREKPR